VLNLVISNINSWIPQTIGEKKVVIFWEFPKKNATIPFPLLIGGMLEICSSRNHYKIFISGISLLEQKTSDSDFFFIFCYFIKNSYS